MAGRDERETGDVAKVRLPNLSRYYKGRLREIEAGRFEFSAVVYGGKRPQNLSRVLESVEWRDEGPTLAGAISLRRPHPERERFPRILAGYRVRLRVRYRGGWYHLWTMSCAAPQIQLEDGTISVELGDPLVRLRRNRREWSFRKTEKRGRGYFAHEITKAVCKREGVRVGKLAKGKKDIKKLVKESASALEMIQEAYDKENEKTGIRYIIRIQDGRLEVRPYARNRILYLLREQITSASLQQEQDASPVTVIDAKGKVGKGKDAEKVKARVFKRQIVRRFGWVVKEEDYGKVDSQAALRRLAQRDLAKAIRPTRTASLTVQGIPFLRRGDGARWLNREPGWYGKEVEHSRDRTFIYIKSATHSVSADGYTTELTIGQEDPYRKDKERLDELRRERAKERREREREEEQDAA